MTDHHAPRGDWPWWLLAVLMLAWAALSAWRPGNCGPLITAECARTMLEGR